MIKSVAAEYDVTVENLGDETVVRYHRRSKSSYLARTALIFGGSILLLLVGAIVAIVKSSVMIFAIAIVLSVALMFKADAFAKARLRRSKPDTIVVNPRQIVADRRAYDLADVASIGMVSPGQSGLVVGTGAQVAAARLGDDLRNETGHSVVIRYGTRTVTIADSMDGDTATALYQALTTEIGRAHV
jgi:hypothetical protein